MPSIFIISQTSLHYKSSLRSKYSWLVARRTKLSPRSKKWPRWRHFSRRHNSELPPPWPELSVPLFDAGMYLISVGIEAEAVMLGQPISMVLPEVIGYRIYGKLNPMSTSTDVVLTITKVMKGQWSMMGITNYLIIWPSYFTHLPSPMLVEAVSLFAIDQADP